jgi:retron-type reverse transcriptase
VPSDKLRVAEERHQESGGKKSADAGKAAKYECGASLDGNLESLAGRLISKSCKPQPSLRVYISKENGRLRPLEMAGCGGRLAQFALKRALPAAFEPKFRGRMFGFHQWTGCRDALKESGRTRQGRLHCRRSKASSTTWIAAHS